MIKKEYKKICRRFDGVMYSIGVEYLNVSSERSEIYRDRRYYNIEKGVTLRWMLDEASYWLSCYYEPGNIRYEDKHDGEEGYKTWRSETGMLKRLINAIKCYGNLNVKVEED